MGVVGYRFYLSEQELVAYYLKKRILGIPLTKEEQGCIVERNLYGDNATPWELLSDDLPWQKALDSMNRVVGSQKILYVFTVLSYTGKSNSKNKKHKYRVAGSGSWHACGCTKPVMDDSRPGRKIGESKNLTFESQEQTVGHWIMTEYSIDAAANGIPGERENEYSNIVLCKIKRDDSKTSKGGRIVTWKRKNEIFSAERAAKMKSESSFEDLNAVTFDDCSSTNECNEEGDLNPW